MGLMLVLSKAQALEIHLWCTSPCSFNKGTVSKFGEKRTNKSTFIFSQGMEIVQTMNSDPGLAVGEALIFVLLENYQSFTVHFSVQLLEVFQTLLNDSIRFLGKYCL